MITERIGRFLGTILESGQDNNQFFRQRKDLDTLALELASRDFEKYVEDLLKEGGCDYRDANWIVEHLLPHVAETEGHTLLMVDPLNRLSIMGVSVPDFCILTKPEGQISELVECTLEGNRGLNAYVQKKLEGIHQLRGHYGDLFVPNPLVTIVTPSNHSLSDSYHEHPIDYRIIQMPISSDEVFQNARLKVLQNVQETGINVNY